MAQATNTWTDNLYVITGGAGLVGQNLIVAMKATGCRNIVAIDKHKANTAILRRLHPDIMVIEADLAIPGSWEYAFIPANGSKSVPVLLHAQIGGPDEAEFIRNNVTATENVLNACRKAGVEYLVHASSSVVNSMAVDFYTESKKAQEKMVDACGIAHVVLRPTLMFGWFDRKHLGWLARFMQRVPLFPIPGLGRYVRQPLYALDFCHIIMSCLQTRPTGTYDITGLGRTLYVDLIRKLRRAVRARAMLVFIPYGIFYALLWLYALFDRNPPFTRSQLRALVTPDEFEIIDWPGIFGVTATPLDAALEATFNDPRYSGVKLEF